MRHYQAEGPSEEALLVLAHGAGAGQTHPFMVGMARALAAAGVDVVTFDFPYMEARRRVPDRPPVLEARFREVVAGVQARADLSARALYVGGKSMGGRMASHLAAAAEPGVRGLVTLGYPLHPPGRPDQLRTAHLERIAMPWLVVQGERDTFGTPTELAPHLARVPGPVTLETMAGGDHSLAVRGTRAEVVLEGVARLVRDWMRLHR
jgi:hypothetical protein